MEDGEDITVDDGIIQLDGEQFIDVSEVNVGISVQDKVGDGGKRSVDLIIPVGLKQLSKSESSSQTNDRASYQKKYKYNLDMKLEMIAVFHSVIIQKYSFFRNSFKVYSTT